MDTVLEVSIHLGRTPCTNQMTKAMKLKIGGKVLLAELYLFEIKDFDVILDMDWLVLTYG